MGCSEKIVDRTLVSPGFIKTMYRREGWITAWVLLENVTPYANTASMAIFCTQMNDLGYDVYETSLSAKDYGTLENRTRLAAVAVTKGMHFEFQVPEISSQTKQITVEEILDPVPLDDPSWSKMAYLKKKETADKLKKAAGLPGTWFARQEVKLTDVEVPTLTRGYQKRRSTDPMLVHPENPDLLRLFTPKEAARLKGAPPEIVDGMSASRALQVLGQSVAYPPFVAVGKSIGNAIWAFINGKSKSRLIPHGCNYTLF